MKKEDFFNLGLPKWPALLVTGKKVTEDQAMEILIRTSSLHFCSNDKSFEEQTHKLIYGVKASFWGTYDELEKNLGDRNLAWKYVDDTQAQFGVLELSYLQNSRILSSWIGGPHGWCSWDGTIGCSNYNIGKYPGVDDVYNEWVLLAKTFPFLDLTCQLLSGENCEDESKPVVEYRIKEGKVKMKVPKKQLTDTQEVEFRFNEFGRERGCTYDKLEKALRYTFGRTANSELPVYDEITERLCIIPKDDQIKIEIEIVNSNYPR